MPVYKRGAVDFVKVTKIKDVSIWKNKCGFRVCQTYKHVLLLQAFLRQNIMIDSGSRLCDV
jgi:hypothetical protein